MDAQNRSFSNKESLFSTYTLTPYWKINHFISEHAKQITDQVTRIKVQKLSEMLCNVETMKRLKESHVLSLMRYMDLVDELKEVHK